MGRKKNNTPKTSRPKAPLRPAQAKSRDVLPQQAVILMAVLASVGAAVFGAAWAYKVSFLLAAAVVTVLILITLSGATAFKAFRDGYGDLFKLFVGFGMVIVAGALATFFLTPTGEQRQVRQLVESARADAESARIQLQGMMQAAIVKRPPGASLQEPFRRNPLPEPERLIKITGESLVIRHMLPETLGAVTASIKNLKRLKDGLERTVEDANVKTLLVFYVDTLTELGLYLVLEGQRLDGELTAEQVRELHQSMIFDKLTGTGEAYFESAFHDTNLVVGRRVAGLERAFFRVTGRRPR
jgi:hypothetical protein